MDNFLTRELCMITTIPDFFYQSQMVTAFCDKPPQGCTWQYHY